MKIKKHLKFKAKKDLARIVADITGDGHLQLLKNKGVVSFYSKDIKSIRFLARRFEKLFGAKGSVRKYTSGGYLRYGIFYPSKKLCEFLALIGVPAGNKTEKKFLVPKWILKGNKNIKKSYLRGLFASEGSIYATKLKYGKRWRIEMEQYKILKLKNSGRQFMEQIKKMLEKEFDVICSPVRFGKKQKRTDGSFTIAIKIDIEKSSFMKFYKHIGFDNKVKDNKLLNVIAGELSGGSS